MRLLRHIAFASVALLLTLVAGAQGTGLYQFGSFDSRGFDTINRGNLNVHFSIPIFAKPGRSGTNFAYALAYDSLVWSTVTAGGTTTWAPTPGFGWQPQTVVPLTGYISYQIDLVECSTGDQDNVQTYTATITTGYAYVDAAGVEHDVQGYLGGCEDSSNGLGPSNQLGPAVDGSHYTINSDLTVTLPNGSTVSPPTIYELDNAGDPNGTFSYGDPNGNLMTEANGVFTDTTGHPVLRISGGGTAISPLVYTFPTLAPSGATSTEQTYKTYTIRTNFGCNGVQEYGSDDSMQQDLVDRITMADGSYYAFTYEPTLGASNGEVTGRLASVTLPTGGTINYGYSNGCGAGINADGSVGSLSRSLNTGPLVTYSRAPAANGSYTLVMDNGNQTNYQFSNDGKGNFFETARQVYTGPVAGTPLLNQTICYNATAFASCPGQAITQPIYQVDTYATYDGLETNGTTEFVAGGYPTEVDQYDFSMTGSRGQLLQKTLYTYKAFASAYDSLILIPASVTVTDWTGLQISKTTYGYDENSLVATSGLPQRSYVGSNYRGNLTSVNQYTSTEAYLTTINTYYDSGALQSSTFNGQTTRYVYDSTGTFVTGVTLPTPASGVDVSMGQVTDVASGSVTSTTGANGLQTTYSNFDVLGRAQTITYPPGGGSAMTVYPSYNGSSSASANIGSASQTINGSQSTNSQVLYDGFGNATRRQLANGQSGSAPWYQQDTCLDPDGHVTFSSIPYQAAGFESNTMLCSSYGTAFTYDGLGRVLTKQNADGVVQYKYLGAAKQITDMNKVSRIIEKDGLGRIKAVCEVTSNPLPGQNGTPTACNSVPNTGFDLSATGFATLYEYFPAGGITVVTQGLGPSRLFAVDELGRLTSQYEPESGWTQYVYTSNSTGMLVTRTKPTANIPLYTLTANTTTQYQYDSLNRLLSVTYSDGTPAKTYTYDQGDGTLPAGYSTGLLTAAHSGVGTSAATSTWFQYDGMGRVTATVQCFPGQCSNSDFNVARLYAYDLAGNRIQDSYYTGGSSGTRVDTNSTPSVAGEVLAMSNTMTGAGNANGALLSGALYAPVGASSWTYGNGFNGVQVYDGAGRDWGRYVCSGSVSFQCGGGGGIWGNQISYSGVQAYNIDDTASGPNGGWYAYDNFNRLSISSVYSGQNFTYSYDRYGNRWSQTGNGPSPQTSFDAFNHNTSFAYDLAGDVMGDGVHSYTFDADGNVTAVDGGATATYVYDAMNDRVQANVGGTVSDFGFNIDGLRVSTWNGSASTPTLLAASTYWNGQPYAVNTGNPIDGSTGQIEFLASDLTGNVRLGIYGDGGLTGIYTNLPFGDSQTTYYTSLDAEHFGELDYDAESNTHHAQYRQYGATNGSFLSPDPYLESYHFANPQSLNRYTYASNNPLRYLDPMGLDDDDCTYDVSVDDGLGNTWDSSGTFVCYLPGGGGGGSIAPLAGGGGGGASAPSSRIANWFHDKFCSVTASLRNAATNSGSTVGFGIGGNAGIIGTVSGSVQIVADYRGNVGIAGTFGGSWVLGFGAMIGVQGSISDSDSIYNLRGPGMDYGASAGDGFAIGVDYGVSNDSAVHSGTLSFGYGIGGRFSAGFGGTKTAVAGTKCP